MERKAGEWKERRGGNGRRKSKTRERETPRRGEMGRGGGWEVRGKLETVYREKEGGQLGDDERPGHSVCRQGIKRD